MSVEHLEVLVEELSMEAALSVLLPKMTNGISFAIHAHQGKQDLLRKLTSVRAALPDGLRAEGMHGPGPNNGNRESRLDRIKFLAQTR